MSKSKYERWLEMAEVLEAKVRDYYAFYQLPMPERAALPLNLFKQMAGERDEFREWLYNRGRVYKAPSLTGSYFIFPIEPGTPVDHELIRSQMLQLEGIRRVTNAKTRTGMKYRKRNRDEEPQNEQS